MIPIRPPESKRNSRVGLAELVSREVLGGALAAGIQVRVGHHTFRATGITAHLANGGTLEIAQQIAAHESPWTIRLYDCSQV